MTQDGQEQERQRVAIVTGASKGLGLALARALGEQGWRLAIDARGEEALARAARELGERTMVVSLPGDVSDAGHRIDLVLAARALGRVEAVVNNASTLGGGLLDLALEPLDAYRAIFEVNAVAPLALVQLALPDLEANHGVVVNVSSDAAVEAYEGWGGYGSSKAALDHLTRILAKEHPDVHFYAVDPGDMRTDLHQEAFPGEDISDRPGPEASVPGLVALLAGERPSGRYLAREVAAP
jgi:NAD(P)-dependent dehydrogenase (short-subunit alcohol dehydrogenase family)